MQSETKKIEKSILQQKIKKTKEVWFSTGSDLLDIMVGGGIGYGFPAGRIINIVGDKSTGKSFLAAELIASAYHKYGKKFKWNYDDAEIGFTFNTKEIYGFDIIGKDTVHSATVEELYCNYRSFLENLKKDEVGIYVLDSLDGLSSDELIDRSNERYKNWQKGKDFNKGSYQMGSAKFMAQEFFRGLAGLGQEKNVLFVIISQVRDNIDPFSFKKFKRSGGKALDHYCHTVLWLANVSKEKIGTIPIGIVVKALTDKSKTPRPYRQCIFNLLFDYGIDNIGTNIDYLYDIRGDSGKLLNASKNIMWGGDTKISLKSLKEFLEENEKLEECKKEVGLKKDEIINWIENSRLKRKFQNSFGNTMSRKELISYIEENNLENKLKERVFEKWEKIESQAITERKTKY